MTVRIMPTIGSPVRAADLAHANQAMAAQAAEAKGGWPSDVRFAAAPGIEVATAESVPGTLPDGVDALTVPTSAITGTRPACAR